MLRIDWLRSMSYADGSRRIVLGARDSHTRPRDAQRDIADEAVAWPS